MRLLFVKERLAWPRSSGHDVHSYHMMRALIELGHSVGLVTLYPPTPEAIQGLRLERCQCLAENGDSWPETDSTGRGIYATLPLPERGWGAEDGVPFTANPSPASAEGGNDRLGTGREGEAPLGEPLPIGSAGASPSLNGRIRDDRPIESKLTRLQERFRSYWGIDLERVRNVGRLARAFRADAVVVVGLNVLPYLGAVDGPMRIWYAADEWAWHHLSQVRSFRPSTWANLKQAVVKGLYERAYGCMLDRVWVVSEADRRAMRWVAGAREVDVLPNGVDGSHYAPRELPQLEQSCVFWGRLDFGPNIQALEWFCGNVWPALVRQVPRAQFAIYGFQPTPPVEALARLPGIRLVPDLPDIRDEVARQQVVVLPFVSGGGIKNKLLEAASMGKAIVCSPRACLGLSAANGAWCIQARRQGEWVKALQTLWSDPVRCRRLGEGARKWVLSAHTWDAAAWSAVTGLEKTLAEGGQR